MGLYKHQANGFVPCFFFPFFLCSVSSHFKVNKQNIIIKKKERKKERKKREKIRKERNRGEKRNSTEQVPLFSVD